MRGTKLRHSSPPTPVFKNSVEETQLEELVRGTGWEVPDVWGRECGHILALSPPLPAQHPHPPPPPLRLSCPPACVSGQCC